jgi:hypothetical protein
MRGATYSPELTPGDIVARQRIRPMPPREELLKRKSFGSVNDNRYLDIFLKGVRK